MKFLIFLLPLALLIGCSEEQTSTQSEGKSKSSGSGTGTVQFIKFHADWCGPCQAQKPIVAEIKGSYPNIQFKDIDVDKDAETAQKYKVSSIPYMVITVDGQIKEKLVGLQSKEKLNDLLSKYHQP